MFVMNYMLHLLYATLLAIVFGLLTSSVNSSYIDISIILLYLVRLKHGNHLPQVHILCSCFSVIQLPSPLHPQLPSPITIRSKNNCAYAKREIDILFRLQTHVFARADDRYIKMMAAPMHSMSVALLLGRLACPVALNTNYMANSRIPASSPRAVAECLELPFSCPHY